VTTTLGVALRYEAVLCDLLTALLDSWTLWNEVAGGPAAGLKWRTAYLRLTYGAGAYRPYETLVAESAMEVGLSSELAAALATRFVELRPWPEAAAAFAPLVEARIPIGIATNCSESLGNIAAARADIPFATRVTAERAGFYKPHPRPYELALAELQVEPERCLFIAGSAYDLSGAHRVGMPIWWHDRIRMDKPADAPEPLRHTHRLDGLAAFVLGT
jgi:2-haloacid dehalogenase